MADKSYICSYKHCLHNGEKVSALESVVINKRHYHWDCAEMRQRIADCVNLYVEVTEDKTRYPIATRIINTLVFTNKVPVDFIYQNIGKSKRYYQNKPPHVLYGLRKIYWEKI